MCTYGKMITPVRLANVHDLTVNIVCVSVLKISKIYSVSNSHVDITVLLTRRLYSIVNYGHHAVH